MRMPAIAIALLLVIALAGCNRARTGRCGS